MRFSDAYFEDEVRDGFYVPAVMKRSWAAQLEVLEQIAKVCERHQIRWYADRGSLLGAVRHGGFIPWDDDLDICMLRDDYIRFCAAARQELPPEYLTLRIPANDQYFITRICNGNHIVNVYKDYLDTYHGFPYTAGVDIFILDYLSPDPEEEDFRNTLCRIVWNVITCLDQNDLGPEETDSLLAQVEELLQVRIDRNAPLKNQLLELLDQLFALHTASAGEAGEVAYMLNWIPLGTWKFSLSFYQDPVWIPFEETRIAVPSDYDGALRVQFGDHYRIPCRAGGGHDYPYYRPFQKELAKAMGMDCLPFHYAWNSGETSLFNTESSADSQ